LAVPFDLDFDFDFGFGFGFGFDFDFEVPRFRGGSVPASVYMRLMHHA
jgi:hypothetical protein